MKKLVLLSFLWIGLYQLHAQSIFTFDQLRDSIKKEMDYREIPGLMITLVTRDSVIFSGGFGFANLEEEIPVSGGHLFRLGSITKSFAALAIFKLVREGKLSLEDKLIDIAPEVSIQNPWEKTHPVKIKHLLQHSSGFDDMHFTGIYNRNGIETHGLEIIQNFSNSLYCRWPPGSRYSYSNPGFIVISYLIEKFSGQTYNDYVHENLFIPLGMDNSNVDLILDGPEYAIGYNYQKGIHDKVPLYAINAAMAGALNSSADDMARFVRFFLNEGIVDSVSLFTSADLDKMETSETTLAAEAGMQAGYGYANYWSHLNKKVPFHGHDGGIDGFISKYAYNRELGVGYAISNNGSTGFGKISGWIVDFLTQSAQEPVLTEESLPEETVSAYTGYYRFHSSRNELFAPVEFLLNGRNLRYKNDTLILARFLGDNETWIYVGNDQFRNTENNIASLVLAKDSDGNEIITGMRTGYLEKSGFIWPVILRIILMTAVLFNIVMIPAGVIISILQVFGKVDRIISRSITIPFLSSASLLALIVFFFRSLNEMASLGSVNFYTVGTYAAGLLFAALTLISAIRIFGILKSKQPKKLTYVILLFIVLQTSMMIFLIWGDFIGLKTWAY